MAYAVPFLNVQYVLEKNVFPGLGTSFYIWNLLIELFKCYFLYVQIHIEYHKIFILTITSYIPILFIHL